VQRMEALRSFPLKWFVLRLFDEVVNELLDGFLAAGLECRLDCHCVELLAGDLAQTLQRGSDGLQLGAAELLRDVKPAAVERNHDPTCGVLAD